MDDVQILDDPEAASLVLDPTRRAVLAALREPASAAALAATLGTSRQRVRYFLHSLEQRGLVVQVGERRWGGITERLFVASAASYVVSPEALGPVGAAPRNVRDHLSARYLVVLASQAIRDVAVLSRRAATQRRRLATLSLDTTIRFASAAERAQFADELAATVPGLAAKYHRPDARRGRDHHLLVLAYPTTAETTADERTTS